MAHTISSTDRVLTTERESQLARDVLSDLEGAGRVLTVEHRGERVAQLPAEVGRILQQVLDVMSRGGSVTITAMPEVVTTVTAAEMLGISRPTLMKMISTGELPSFKVGSHHRIKAADVLQFERARLARQRAAFEALRELDDREP